MRILHLVYSSAGGTGSVVGALHEAQTKLGLSSEVLAFTQSELRVRPFSNVGETLRAALDEYLVRRATFKGPISVFRPGAYPSVSPDDTPDLIHLHGGLSGWEDLVNYFKDTPIVLSLHDLRSFTGACHQPVSCDGYLSDCSSCPAVKGFWQNAVTRNKEKSNQFLNDRVSHFVFPSRWMQAMARRARNFGSDSTSVIPNPVTLGPIRNQTRHDEVRKYCTILSSSSPSKLRALDLKSLIALKEYASSRDLEMVSIGGNQYDSILVRNLGPLDRTSLSAHLMLTRLAVVPSRYESFSLLTLEALRHGCEIASFQESAPSELALELGTWRDIEDLGTAHTFTGDSAKSFSKYDPSSVAKRYLEVYESVVR